MGLDEMEWRAYTVDYARNPSIYGLNEDQFVESFVNATLELWMRQRISLGSSLVEITISHWVALRNDKK
jgi:hypothetical protein